MPPLRAGPDALRDQVAVHEGTVSRVSDKSRRSGGQRPRPVRPPAPGPGTIAESYRVKLRVFEMLETALRALPDLGQCPHSL